MKIYLKSVGFVIIILIGAVTHSVNAHPKGPLLFNFTLTVKNVSDHQIYVGNTLVPPIGQNTYKINVRKSDYLFKVQHQHNGQNKEAICPITGAPRLVTAIIDPTKDGWDACRTEESGRKENMAAL